MCVGITGRGPSKIFAKTLKKLDLCMFPVYPLLLLKKKKLKRNNDGMMEI